MTEEHPKEHQGNEGALMHLERRVTVLARIQLAPQQRALFR